MNKFPILGKHLILLIAFGLVACAKSGRTTIPFATPHPTPSNSPTVPSTPTPSPTQSPSRTPTRTTPTKRPPRTPTPTLPIPTFSAGVQLVAKWDQRFYDAAWKEDQRLALEPDEQSAFGGPGDLIYWNPLNVTPPPDVNATATSVASENFWATREADVALGRFYFHNRQYYLTCADDYTASVFRSRNGQLIAKLERACYPAGVASREPFFSIAWTTDDTRLAATGPHGLQILNLADGTIQTLVGAFVAPEAELGLSWSPDSTRIAYLRPGDYPGEAKVSVVEASGRTPPLLFEEVIGVGNESTYINWASNQVIERSRLGGPSAYYTLYNALTGEMLADWSIDFSYTQGLRPISDPLPAASPDQHWLVVDSNFLDYSYRVIDFKNGTSIRLYDNYPVGEMHFSHWTSNSDSFYYTYTSQETDTAGLYVFNTSQLTTTLLAKDILIAEPGPSPNTLWAFAQNTDPAKPQGGGIGLFDLRQRHWVKPPQVFLADSMNVVNVASPNWQLGLWSISADRQAVAFIDPTSRTLNVMAVDSTQVLANNLPVTQGNANEIGIALSPSGKFVFVNLENEAWLLRID